MPIEKTIRLVAKKMTVEVPLGMSMPLPTAGGSLIEEQARPGRESVSVYAGDALEKWDVPILFDSWGPNHFPRQPGKRRQGLRAGGHADQTPRIQRVMALARSAKGNPPPHFKVKGPVLFSGKYFWMESMPEWATDPEPIIEDDGTILRLAMILHLIEWNPAQALKWRRTVGGLAGSISYPDTYTLPEAMNLVKVAMIVFGSPELAPAIGKLNAIHDVQKSLPKGKKLRLPDEEGALYENRPV